MKAAYRKFSALPLILLILAACSDLGDPVILVPELELEVPAVDFSAVTLGNNQLRQVFITNSGLGDLQGELSLTQPGTAFSLTPSGSYQLLAGDTLMLQIGFQPAAESIYTGDILVSSNAPGQEESHIQLAGSGTSVPVPALTLSQTSLNFGSIDPGATLQRQFSIQSSGTDTLQIDSIRVNSSKFVSDAPSAFALAPGAARLVTVSFSSATTGTFSGTLQIYSNTAGSPHLIELSASVVTPVSYAADIQPLFDNSCSGCHGGNGGLFLTSYADLMERISNNGPVVIAGDGANSLLVKKLKGTAGSRMPVGGPFFSDALIASIETWIDQGAHNN